MTSSNSQISDALLATLYRGTPVEARALALNLSASDQARLAIFCNSKAHLRAHGRAIASVCTETSLGQEGGFMGVMLLRQVNLEPDSWGGSGRAAAAKTISLGKVRGKAK